MWTSTGQGDGSPLPFYERYGFEQTGDIVFDDEVLLRLALSPSGATATNPLTERPAAESLSVEAERRGA